MPRPAVEQEVCQAVPSYLAAAVNKPPAEAPLNVLAVAKRTGFDRKTLKKYGLDVEITAAAKQQSSSGKLSPQQEQRRSHIDALHQRDQEIIQLRDRVLRDDSCLRRDGLPSVHDGGSHHDLGSRFVSRT